MKTAGKSAGVDESAGVVAPSQRMWAVVVTSAVTVLSMRGAVLSTITVRVAVRSPSDAVITCSPSATVVVSQVVDTESNASSGSVKVKRM